MTTAAPIVPLEDDPNRDYGDKIAKIEPGGVEPIPLDERHGKPHGLFWTWTSPNMEFATITVGLLGPIAFGMDFKQSVLAIVVGTLLGSVTHAVLSSWGPSSGLPQMVLSRRAFGFLGNIMPAGINSLVAGIGWFAVNSVSGALALHALAHGLPKALCLLIIVVAQIVIAFLGHNLVHAFERYAFPVLTIVFVVGGIIVFSKAHFSAPASYHGGIGGFLIMTAAAFGYACGWNPYAADYTRYLAPDSPRKAVGLYAGAGVLVSCVFLEIVGAAVATAAKNPAVDPSTFSNLLPTWLGKLALLCIAIGAVAANALNIYSGALSFVAVGIKLPTHIARAVVAGVFGVIGFFVALSGLHGNTASKYENFLLIISYWIGPWLAVVLLERIFRRRENPLLWLGERNNVNWAGPIAMGVATAVSIWLFANQPPKYVGYFPTHHPKLGDLTFEVGFVLAALLYAALFPVFRQKERV